MIAPAPALAACNVSGAGYEITAQGSTVDLDTDCTGAGTNAVTVTGDVDGVGNSGINDAPGGAGNWAVTINNGVTVGGFDGMLLESAGASVDNSGAVTSTDAEGIQITGSGGVVTNRASGAIDAYKDGVEFDGAFGTVNNYGDITSADDSGVTMRNGGTVTNYGTGTITGDEEGVLIGGGAGTVDNYGTIESDLQEAVELNGGGQVTNRAGAVMRGAEIGVDLDGGYSTLDNSGEIFGDGEYGVEVRDGGTVTNRAGARIAGDDSGVVFNGDTGTLINAGMIDTTGTTPEEAVKFENIGGAVTNVVGGTIAGGQEGIEFEGASGTVDNSGTVTSDTRTAINLRAGGDVTNSSTGIITGVDNGVAVLDGTGSVDNDGSITASNGPGVYFQNAGGTITNTANGIITGQQEGVWAQSAITVNNAGAITGTDSTGVYLEAGGTLNNSGTIESTTHTGVNLGSGTLNNEAGGRIEADDHGVAAYNSPITVNNSGSITGGIYGVFLYVGGTVNNFSGGAIDGDRDGVNIRTTAGMVTNAGEISGNNDESGVEMTAGGTVNNEAGGIITGDAEGIMIGGGSGSVTNGGTITGLTNFAVRLGAGGSVTNLAGGTIRGTSNAAGVFILNGTGAIDNSGSIYGDDDEGVELQAGGTIVNRAGGLIEGEADQAIEISGAAGDITNAGTINSVNAASGSTVLFAGFDDRFEIQPGSAVTDTTTGPAAVNPGIVQANAGTDTLAFGGAGAESFDISTVDGNNIDNGEQYLNFETFLKEDDSTFTFTGDNAEIGAFAVNGGRLAVNGDMNNTVFAVNGGTLGGSGTVGGITVAAGGTVGAGNSVGTLTVDGDLIMKPGSALQYELGDPSGTAGVDSDLINVIGAGNLTLDGTLNLTDAGGFGNGLYRLINYSGALADNGLDIGTTPGGFSAADLAVQTATAGQVNLLVDAAAVPLTFWNGAVTAADGTIHGGSGTWDATATNWTDAAGATSGPYDPSSFLIFAGANGTVTVDDGSGAIEIQAGMQFAADGYSITGDDIGLGGATVVRVGDGTAAGATFTATIASRLTGTGSLEKTDLGTLVLTGANSYTGATRISGGTLVNNGSLAGAVTVAGGTYGGSGSSGALTVTGGTVGPGNSIGTLAVNDALNLGAGSTYALEVDAAGNNDLIDVTGTVTLEGGTLSVLATGGGTYGPNTDYIIIANDGADAVDGAFDTVTTDLAFLTPTVDYAGGTGNDVALTLARNATTFASVGGTYNQIQSATGLAGLDQTAGTDAATVYNTILGLSAPYAQAAFDLASGEVHASAQHMTGATSSLFRRTLNEQGKAGVAGPSNRQAGNPVSPMAYGERPGPAPAALALGYSDAVANKDDHADARVKAAWAAPLGGAGLINGDGNAASFGWWTAGMAGGFEGQGYAGSGRFVAGVSAGYLHGVGGSLARYSGVTADSFNLGAYGAWANGDWTISGAAAWSAGRLETQRAIVVGPLVRQATASYWTHSLGITAEAARNIDLGSVTFSPLASIDAGWGGHAAAMETGAGALNLAIAGESHGWFDTGLGLGIAKRFTTVSNRNVTLDARAVWEHSFGSTTPNQTMAFAGSPTAFNVRGPAAGRDRLRVGAGFGIESGRTTVSAHYDGSFFGGQMKHEGNLNLTVRF